MIDECCTTGISPGISFDNEVFYPDTVMRTVQFYFDNDGRSFAVNLNLLCLKLFPHSHQACSLLCFPVYYSRTQGADCPRPVTQVDGSQCLKLGRGYLPCFSGKRRSLTRSRHRLALGTDVLKGGAFLSSDSKYPVSEQSKVRGALSGCAVEAVISGLKLDL